MGTEEQRISRRTVTQGIAWTAPVVALAGTAPAFAASPGALGDVCKIYEGSGTQNYQTQYVYFKITPTDGNTTIPQGTTLTWTFTVGTSSVSSSQDIDFMVPTTSFSSAGLWTLTTSKPAGTRLANGESFTVTWTATQTITSTDLAALRDCSAAYIIWSDTASVDPNTQITVVNPVSSPNPSASLTWITPERDTAGTPLVFLNSSTGCYPEVQYSNFNNSFTGNCATSNACVTYQQAGVTVQAMQAKGSGDQSVPATCNPAALLNCVTKTFSINLADLKTSGTKTATATDGSGVTYSFTYTTSSNGTTLLNGNLNYASGKLYLFQKGANSQVAGSTVGQLLSFDFPTAVTNVNMALGDISNSAIIAGYQDQITLYSSTNNTGWVVPSNTALDPSLVRDGTTNTYYRDSTLGAFSNTVYNTNALTSFGLLFNNRKSGTSSLGTQYQDMTISSITFDAYVCP